MTFLVLDLKFLDDLRFILYTNSCAILVIIVGYDTMSHFLFNLKIQDENYVIIERKY